MKKTVLLILCVGYSIVNYSHQKDSISILKESYRNTVSDSTKIVLSTKIAKLFIKKNKDSAIYYYQKAFNISKKSNDKSVKAKALYNLAFFEMISNSYVNSIKNFEELQLIYTKLNNPEKVAKIYNNIGYCYMELYDENNAFENFIKSLKIYKALNNKNGIALNYDIIGTMFYDQENYKFAQKYYADALAINLKLNDSSDIAINYTNLGNAVSDAGDYKQGLVYYQKSTEISKALKDDSGVSTNYNNIADSYKQLEDYNKAKLFLKKSLGLADKLNDKGLISVIYLNKAEIEHILNNNKLAIKYAKISNTYADESGNLEYKTNNFKTLSNACESLGNIKKAYYYNKQYISIKDSINKINQHKTAQLFKTLNELEKSNSKINKLATENEKAKLKNEKERKFIYALIIALFIFAFLAVLINTQYTKKQEAYNLLEYQNFKIYELNDEIEKQKNYLEKVNNAKDKFFSIIAHDLKNPFNSIKGFTDLLLENGDIYTEEKKKKFLKIIASSTTKASELLNNLLIWANSQSGKIEFNPEKIDLNDQILNVNSFLEAQALSKDIEIKTHLDSNIFVYADKNMINTILRNLISNAIKFTNEKGIIEITSKENKKEVFVEVKDNGVGISEEDLKHLFSLDFKKSTNGTANEQGSGLGLLLCKEFVEKNDGELTVTSELNKGSVFKFTLLKWQKNS